MSKVTYDDIVCYLTSLNVTQKEIKACPQQWADLQHLAQAHGGDLKRKEDVLAAGAEHKQVEKANKLSAWKLRPLSQGQKDRIRLAFDHFDADASGKLDIEEFRKVHPCQHASKG